MWHDTRRNGRRHIIPAISQVKGCITLIVLTLSALAGLSTSSLAKLEGVPWVQITVNGQTYEIPIYNPDAQSDVYLIKKALSGDAVARDILLQGKDERWLFIGDGDVKRWLKLTPSTEEITEY